MKKIFLINYILLIALLSATNLKAQEGLITRGASGTPADDSAAQKQIRGYNKFMNNLSNFSHYFTSRDLITFELNKDPELLARYNFRPSGRHTFSLDGGLKLTDGFTKLYSSKGFTNINWNANFSWVFKPYRLSRTSYFIDGNPARLTEGWFSLKFGLDQTNETLFSPFVGSIGNPNLNINDKHITSTVWTASYYLQSSPSSSNHHNISLYFKGSYIFKPKDNNLGDLDNFTLTGINTITDTANNSTYTISTDSKTGKYGTYKEMASHSLKADFTTVWGQKQNFAFNFNMIFSNKDSYNTLLGEVGLYFPIKTSGSDDTNSKFGNLGIIMKTKDLINTQVSFDKKLYYGIKIGFPI